MAVLIVKNMFQDPIFE